MIRHIHQRALDLDLVMSEKMCPNYDRKICGEDSSCPNYYRKICGHNSGCPNWAGLFVNVG